MLGVVLGGADGLCGVLEHGVCRVCRAVCVVDVGSIILSTQVDDAEFRRKSRVV